MILRVGQSPSKLSIARYGKHLHLLEVRLDNGAPRKRTLETMKSEAPARLAFAVLLPKHCGALDTDVTEADVTPTVETARGLGARFIVVRTPPTARPGTRTRARLGKLIELLKVAEIAIVWEPTGCSPRPKPRRWPSLWASFWRAIRRATICQRARSPTDVSRRSARAVACAARPSSAPPIAWRALRKPTS